jgi:putative tricarboxylic transport membrane protein
LSFSSCIIYLIKNNRKEFHQFLAFVLGGLMEENLRRSLLISNGSFNFLWDRPLTTIILGFTIAIVSWQIYKSFKKN